MVTSKCEVLVDFGSNPDENLVNKALNELKSQDGIKNAEFKNGAILVDTVLPSSQVINLVSNATGKRTVLQGFGETKSAVAMISDQKEKPSIVGVVRFLQVDDNLVVDGSIDGLPTGLHGLHIHETGDLSQGCEELGGHYNPRNCRHGSPELGGTERHAGDLGNIVADEQGRSHFRILDRCAELSEIIGRSIAVSERADDLGEGNSPLSKIDGNSGRPLACGIIARSAGVFQNPKRVCQCDGTLVWDERDRPLASVLRKQQQDNKKSCCGKHKEI